MKSPARQSLDASLDRRLAGLRGSGVRRILEIGCGTGEYAVRFAEMGFEGSYVGIDIEERATWAGLAGWHGDFDVTFRRMDAHDLSSLSGPFDMVFAYEMLEHVRHPPQVLREARRLLRPGGHFLASVPARGGIPLYLKHGLRYFSERGLRRVMRGAGFEDVRIRRIGGAAVFFHHLGWWTIPNLLGFRIWEAKGTRPALYDRVRRRVEAAVARDEGRTRPAHHLLVYSGPAAWPADARRRAATR